MSLWYKLHELKQSMKKLAHSARCSRCGLYFEKAGQNCPHCAGIEDADLEILVKERESRISSIGRGMIFGAIFILVFLILVVY